MNSDHWCRVLRFALLMDKKLAENMHKGDWRTVCSPQQAGLWLIARLKAELGELEAEIIGNPYRGGFDAEAIGLECADVANFALMIADIFGALGEVP